jgi:hypothetical protein
LQIRFEALDHDLLDVHDCGGDGAIRGWRERKWTERSSLRAGTVLVVGG